MKLFEAVKEAVTARSAEYYGIKVGRNGMAVCPFHPDKNPSMKLDKRYHCFACQADGDVIDFVAKYFNLSVKESAEKLAEDFSVPYEKYQSYNKTKDYQKPKQKKQTLDQFFHEQQIRFFRVYSDYFHLLKKWKVEYAPRIEDDDWHPLFVEAMEKYTLIEYKMDVLLSGSLEDRARLILDCQEEVKNIEQRIKAIYKDNADTIEGNCDTTLFLGGKEKTTLKEIAEILGKETIDLYNTSDTRGSQRSYGMNYQKTGKELMSQDEIAVMDGGKCILQVRGVRPFFSNKYDICKHKNYKYLSDYDKKNTFDIEKYLSTNLILKPEDEVELYQM